MLSREDRIRGCLLGGSLGDAIGAHFEGAAAGSDFELPSRLRVTDDTQLTIATCEAIVESQAISPEAIASRFVCWFRDRRISGIGSSTLKALTELAIHGSDFMTSVQQLASLGGDVDTIASMFGQVFGTAWGLEALPSKLLEAVDATPLVYVTATKLSRVSIALDA